MKKSTKICCVILAAVIVLMAIHAGHIAYLVWGYRSLEKIEVLKIGKASFEATLPVQPLSERLEGTFRSFLLTDRTKKNYCLRWDRDTGKMFISITRWECGGFVVMGGTYEISDGTVAGRVADFMKNHEAEVDPDAWLEWQKE